MENIFGTEMCIKFESKEISITGDYSSKSDSKEEGRGKGTVVCVACRRRDSESDRLSTRRSKTQLLWFLNQSNKHHYHCSSFSFVWMSRCFSILIFVLCVIAFHKAYVVVCCGGRALSASFFTECTDVSFVAGEDVEFTVHKESVSKVSSAVVPQSKSTIYNVKLGGTIS